jgi:2-keto-4-pentenoate hydratase
VDAAAQQGAARWLAEAFETGNPLAPLPPELTPATAEDGEAIAALVLDAAGFTACGVRLARASNGDAPPVAGPMLEGRLLRDGVTVALAALRHPRATAAVAGVLARALPPEGEEPPVLAALHPAIDLADSRFRDAPGTAALLAADLGGLGMVVVGSARPPSAGEVPVSLAPEPRRPRGAPVDLAAALHAAAAAARRLGGLPEGALLVATGLSGPAVPVAGMTLTARFGGLGRVRVAFA